MACPLIIPTDEQARIFYGNTDYREGRGREGREGPRGRGLRTDDCADKNSDAAFELTLPAMTAIKYKLTY